eukprot:PhF_6_TR463/c5_g2_i2/m.194
MLSLIHASVTTDNHSHMKRLPNDCVCHIISFCTPSMTSVCYLVCRSWYHAVDRYLCLGDNFYYVPESFQPKTEITRRFPIEELNTLRDDVRLQHTQVLYLTGEVSRFASSPWVSFRSLRKLDASGCKMPDTCVDGIESILTLEELNLSNTGITDVSHLSECRSLRILNAFRCQLTDAGIRGLETIPTLEELDLSVS